MLDLFTGKTTSKDWIFIGAILGAAVVLAGAFYFGVYTLQSNRLAETSKKLADVKTQLKAAYDIKQNAEKLQTEVSKMDDLVNRFQSRLPDEREIPQLLRKFEALGDNMGLRVELASQATISDESKETIPYKVTAHGNFHQIAGFINLLERDERYLKVSEIDIGEEEAGVSQCTFILSTFRFTQSAPSAEGEQAKPGEKK